MSAQVNSPAGEPAVPAAGKAIPSLELRELVLQGVTGVPTEWRVPLGHGVTIVHPADERAALLVNVMLLLAYPDRADDPAPLRELQLAGAAQSRFWLSVGGRDGAVYSLLADAVAGRRALMKEGAAGAMEPVATEAADIRRAGSLELGFPPETLFRGLFVTRREDMPSQKGKPAAAAADDAAVDPRSEGERAARLTEVNRLIARVKRLEGLETELDSLKEQVRQLDNSMGPIHQQRAVVDAAEARLKTFADMAAIPADFGAQVAGVRRLRAEAAQALQKIETQRRRPSGEQTKQEELLESLDDPLIRYGGIAFFVLLLVGLIGGPFIPIFGYLGLLALPALGVAGFGALRFFAKLDAAKDVKKKLLLKMTHDQERVKAQLDIDESSFKSMLDRAGVSMTSLDDTIEKGVPLPGAQRHRTQHDVLDELVVRVEERAAAVAARDAAVAELKKLGGSNTLGERAALEARARAVDDEIVEGGGSIGSTRELELEAVSLSRSLGIAIGPAEDTAQPLLDLAGAFLTADLAGVVALVKDRVAAYVGRLSGGRLKSLAFGPKGEVSAVDAAGASIPFTALPLVDRDIVYLSLKLTIIETGVRSTRLPVVFERALDVFPEAQAPVLVLLLQFLGSLTQVLVTTSQPALLPAAQDRVSPP
ncbi:MAG: hypothetical protein Q8O67_08530 [Deltaproteobacteria bacterium]|nr:hypothetical protein [Deltaproteobacteria bacterium]